MPQENQMLDDNFNTDDFDNVDWAEFYENYNALDLDNEDDNE